MCYSKERRGEPEILQPAQGHNIDKEGQTETSVGGGRKGPEGWGEGEGVSRTDLNRREYIPGGEVHSA